MSNIDEVNETRKLHPLAVKPVECDESGRQVKIEYVDGCAPPVDDYNFEKAYFCVSGFIPQEYQSLISASPDMLEALQAIDRLWTTDAYVVKEMGITFDDESTSGFPMGVAWKQVRAAIAKALGQ